MIYTNGKVIDCVNKSTAINNLSSQVANVSTILLIIAQTSSRFISHLTAFQTIFGVSSWQTAQSIFINKSELNSLSPKPNNTAESLLVSLINRLLLFTPYSNENIEVYLWGISVANNIKIYTVIILLQNKLTTIDTYELPSIDSIVKPTDYDLL